LARGNIIVGFVMLAIAGVYFFLTIQTYIRIERYEPVYYPFLLAILMSILCIILISKNTFLLYKQKSDDKDKQKFNVWVAGIFKNISFSPAIKVIIIALLYGYFMEVLGHLVATPLALLAILLALEVKKVTTILGVSLITSIVIHYSFANFLNVLLP